MTAQERSAGPVTTRVESIVEFLEGAGLTYEVLEHEPTMSAAREARATHYPPDQVAKTVVLHDGGGYMIAAIPASERLDLHKLRAALGATRDLRLAGEDEIAHEFPLLEVGAVPPFGPTVPAVEVFDHALLRHEQILFPAGDHRHSVLVDPHEVVRVSAAKTAGICQD